MNDGQRIALVLGIDANRVEADSLTLEPYGSSWLVRWRGVAVLDGTAAAILFAKAPDHMNGRSER